MKKLVVVILFLPVFVAVAQKKNQQKFPEPPDSLPKGVYFGSDSFGDKQQGIVEEALAIYINDESNDLQILLDSVAAG